MVTPEKCLICGSAWRGGAQLPNQMLPPNSRVFYDCGAALSYTDLDNNAVKILITNCLGKEIVYPCDGL